MLTNWRMWVVAFSVAAVIVLGSKAIEEAFGQGAELLWWCGYFSGLVTAGVTCWVVWWRALAKGGDR